MEYPQEPAEYRPNGKYLYPQNDQAIAFCKKRDGKRVFLAEISHSYQEHRLLFKFVYWLWHEYWTERFPLFENFRYFLSVSVGWHELKMVLNETKSWVTVLEAKSWSFSRANHPSFHMLVGLVSSWGEKNHGVSIDSWCKQEQIEKPRRYYLKGNKNV